MTAFCYITTCKGRLAHLQQSLPRIAKQLGVACLVVDYSCPDLAADWVTSHVPDVKVVRVEGEPGFNVSRARNLGAQATDAEWLGFFDADTLLDENFAALVVPNLRPGYFYCSNALTRQTCGAVICRRDDFFAIGKYDENFDGWGGEDNDLITRLMLSGRQRGYFPASLLGEISHSDELRTRFHQIKDVRLQLLINTLYWRAKTDMMRLYGVVPSDNTLQTLFNEVRRTIVAGNRKSTPVKLEINLPATLMQNPFHGGRCEITGKLVYSMDLQDATISQAEKL